MLDLDLTAIRCVVFDFGFTLSSDVYFTLAPDGYPHWRDLIQQHIFEHQALVNAWMTGDLQLVDIARIVAQHVALPLALIIETMERGCSTMHFNPAVWEFACAQRAQGRKTALVTANMDVFSTVVIPAHGLDRVFDVILNTSDYRELRKELLWDRAFKLLGDDLHYATSLLVEDGPKEPALFRARGGYAYQYENDERFRAWLQDLHWTP